MSEDVKKISDHIHAGGQPTPDDLKQAAATGFQSVLNLRASGEANALLDEQQQAEAAGLHYAQVPLQPTAADDASIHDALAAVESLPKPVLIHCGAGNRAGAIGLIATAQELGWTLEQLTEKAQEVGISLDQPHLQQFIQSTFGRE